jgi:hypothetical protein
VIPLFCDIVLSASGHCIPSGHRTNYSPGHPRDAVPLVNRRDDLRRADPPVSEVANFKNEINEVICESSRKAWTDKVTSCAPCANRSQFWGLLRNLSGKRVRQPPNQPIMFGKKVFTKPQSISKKFCRQYTSVGTHKQNPETRRVIRSLKHKHKIDANFSPFTDALTTAALAKSSNSTAMGPDGLTSLHLKHLGPHGISFLTKIYSSAQT